METATLKSFLETFFKEIFLIDPELLLVQKYLFNKDEPAPILNDTSFRVVLEGLKEVIEENSFQSVEDLVIYYTKKKKIFRAFLKEVIDDSKHDEIIGLVHNSKQTHPIRQDFSQPEHCSIVNFRLSSFAYGPIVMKPSVPEELNSLVVPGSQAFSSEGNYGKILFQEIKAGDITLLYNIYQIKQDISIDFRYNQCNLQAQIALQNDGQYYINGAGDLYLAEGQFNIIDATNLDGAHFLEKDNEYRTLQVFFSSAMLYDLFPAFNYLQESLASDSAEPRLLFHVHSWLTPQLKDIIDKIMNCSFTGEILQYYRELKAREFICLALTPHIGGITAPSRLTRRNIEIVRATKNILDKAFDHHMTIASIALQMGINEFKLKADFKQVFGISMFDYLIKRRMQAARSLLLETDKPIKEIASLTGYSTKQSFLNAFKKYFHDTPCSLRRN
jgi:AraC-like DNA-binding protein